MSTLEVELPVNFRAQVDLARTQQVHVMGDGAVCMSEKTSALAREALVEPFRVD